MNSSGVEHGDPYPLVGPEVATVVLAAPADPYTALLELLEVAQALGARWTPRPPTDGPNFRL